MNKKIISVGLLAALLLPFTPQTGDVAPVTTSNSAYSESQSVIAQTSDAYEIQSISIAGTDISSYVIVLPEDAPECLRFAASELSSYIEKACGVKLETAAAADHEHVIELVIDGNGTWREQGFTIKTEDGKLTIAGQSDTACLYGVYEFLESYIGWRFLTPDAQALLPAGDTIEIPNGIEVSEEPGVTYRSLFTPETLVGKVEGYNAENVADFLGQMRLNADNGTISSRQGTAGMKWATGRYVHTFGTLAFGEHSSKQPCLSDETVYQNMLATALK